MSRIQPDAILDALRIGVLAIDREGRVMLQNPEASRILGLSSDATRGRRPEEFLEAGHPGLRLLSEARLHGRARADNGCTLQARSAASEQTVDLAATPLGIPGESEGAVLTLHDHTIGRELQALAEQRVQAELFARLASGVAHEIRNPLGGIRGAAELLLNRLEEADLQRYPELIRDETDRIRRLLDDLSELTRGGELCPIPLNLHQVLDGLIDLQSTSSAWQGVAVVREYDPSIPEILLDPDRIRQVFLNLLRNAVQAMNGKGGLVIRTRIEAEFHLTSAAEPPVRMIRIDIDDTGPGFPEGDLPHLFTPFFTRREQGTGLGLALTQHWVVRHGGHVSLSNRAEGGTRARVRLPLQMKK